MDSDRKIYRRRACSEPDRNPQLGTPCEELYQVDGLVVEEPIVDVVDPFAGTSDPIEVVIPEIVPDIVDPFADTTVEIDPASVIIDVPMPAPMPLPVRDPFSESTAVVAESAVVAEEVEDQSEME